MVLSNTVLKLNLKGRGESLVWHNPLPIIEEGKVDAYFPQTADDLCGPNVGLSSERISQNLFFLTTTSRWNLKDEFNRRGIALSQGILLGTNQGEPTSLADVCNSFDVLLKIHRTRYDTLTEALEYLAKEGDASDAQKLVMEISSSFDHVNGECDMSLITSLVRHLKSRVGRTPKGMRVDMNFPWSEDLGFFSLLGLQVLSEDIKSIGGGKLRMFDRYQHISTPQEVPGFEYVDLNKQLTPLKSFVDITSSSQDKGGKRMVINRLRRCLAVVNTPLFCVFLILSVGAILIYQQRMFFRKLDTLAGNSGQTSKLNSNSNTSSSRSTDAPSSHSEQEDPALKQTIPQLYDRVQSVRVNAISKLIQDKSSHEKLVPIAIKYANDHPTDKNGLINTFFVFQKCDPQILKKNRDEIIGFLELLSKSNPNTPGVSRMKAEISKP
jgi:hypothetical protein